MQQLKPLTLRRNFSWTFIGNAVYAACQWGMLVVLAKLGSPEMVGQFTLGLAVTAPVIMFTNLQLRSVQATDAKNKYLFADYLGLRLLSTTLGLLIIATITLISGHQWQTSLIILLVGLAKAFESISDVYYGLIQQHERMDRMAMSLMIKGPLSLLLLGMGVYISHQLVWGVVGLVLAWAAVLVGYDIRSGAYILNGLSSQKLPLVLDQPKIDGWRLTRGRGDVPDTGNINETLSASPRLVFSASLPTQQTLCDRVLVPRWDLKILSKLVWLALPMGFVMMLISLNTNIPKYFIDGYLGQRELGVFAAISYLMVAGNMVVNALGQSATPRLAKYYVAGNRVAFHTLLLKLVGIAALMGGVGVLIVLVAGRQILTILYRPEYAQYTDVFVWLMVAAGIDYISSFLGYGMTAARYFRIQMPLFASVTATSAVVCLWSIPIWGLQGAAIALIMAAIVQAGFSWGVIIHALHKIHTPQALVEQKN